MAPVKTEAVEYVKSVDAEGERVHVEVVRPRAGAAKSLGKCVDCGQAVYLGHQVLDDDSRRAGERPLHALCLIPKQ